MLLTKKFQRKKENFTCENCESYVKGNGYTNHCPYCLWSKHVDVNPGDRASDCGGMMRPIGLENGRILKLTHKCETCGHEKRNKASKEDKIATLFPWQ